MRWLMSLDLMLAPLDDPDVPNKVGDVMVIASDSSPTVLAGRQTAAEFDRQRSLLEHAPSLVIVMRGPEHVVEFVNRAHRRLFDSDTWSGKPIRAAFPDGAGQGFFEMLDRVYAAGETEKAHAASVRYRKPGIGTERPRFIDFISAPIVDDIGYVSGVFCEGFDVTGHVEAAAELL